MGSHPSLCMCDDCLTMQGADPSRYPVVNVPASTAHPISEKKLGVAALLEGTTPGPWRVSEVLSFAVSPAIAECFGQDCATANARLIAETPRLAAEHIALTKKVDELEAALWRIVGIGEDDDSDAEAAWQAMFDIARTALNDTAGKPNEH